ncbi:LytR/AlgR family response regulator transcription factor [Mucilaginibacter calamicampi]|uniref:LytR/AlgR family response regulator transcription factor n=1 Tax=Mucilaginibacter calamicampi TaxID=1302352 RepID=A0ABW2YVT1_9SPHI
MLKIVVIDDEPLALEVIAGHLTKLEEGHAVWLFSKAGDALRHLKNNQADVLMLDIELPEMTGIELLKQLPDPPLTIFTTAYRDYAFEGFELGVIDFLLKPISFKRFSAAMGKVKDFISLKTQNTQLEVEEAAPEFIFVKSGVKRIKLYFERITHVQGLKDYAIIHTKDEKIVVKGSIKTVQEMFPPDLFIRVHKSFLVSRSFIKILERNRIVIGEHQIPIGRNYRDEVEKVVK